MKVNVMLTSEQYMNLGFGKIKNDNLKGEVIEHIVKEAMLMLGADDVYKNTDLKNQIYNGDLLIIKDNKKIFAEIKSSHTFRKTKTDKLALDYKYYKKGTRFTKEYKQSTTDSNLGWLYFTQADWLISYNIDSSKMYVIKDYQKLKEIVIEHIENYYSKLKYGARTWYLKGYNNFIHKFLDGSIKEDSCKESLIVNLELSKKSIEYFNSRLFIIDVIIEVEEDKKDNKKILSSLATKSISKN